MLTDPLAHLRLALSRLDLLIHREIVRLRSTYALSLDEFRGLYISDEQVDRLANQLLLEENDRLDVVELTNRANAIAEVVRSESAADLRWARLRREFDLSQLEEDVLLLATALEADAKYETLFAYLNNNVARKWPTLDLAVRLFADRDSDVREIRRALLPTSTLVGEGLIDVVQPPDEPVSRLSSAFRVSEVALKFILELENPGMLEPVKPPRASGLRIRSADDSLEQRLARAFACFGGPETKPPMLIFEGNDAAVLREAAESMCSRQGISLQFASAESLVAAGDDALARLKRVRLEHRLYHHGLCVEGIHDLLNADGNPLPHAAEMFAYLTDLRGPVILTCASGTGWKALLRDCRAIRFVFPDSTYEERLGLWQELVGEGSLEEDLLEGIASRFSLSTAQIRRVYERALDLQRIDALPELRADLLFEAARFESGRHLGKLAVKVKPKHRWDDLVLPKDTMSQVKEIAAAVKHRHLVYRAWGMEKRVTYGRGLKVLFTGSSGTGKTMTASVIAHELSLDLFKIDLSGIVSRYVGQTEKNLDRIFRAAATSNAILFFDEADALFGKRSEVKDAHDRYANIEISYLLMKMDEFDGVVILATNLKKNIDLAFSRRMHYVVEFPTPDESQRERLWRGMMPDKLPLDVSVDFGFLAQNFELSGGDIQNVVLDASFQAAQDGRIVTMKQIVNAVARQLRKQGRLPSASDFRQYFGLIGNTNGTTATAHPS